MDKQKKYTAKQKKKLADKIAAVKTKDDLIKIFDIIYKENKAIAKNDNGVFMYFHKLTDDTYLALEQYLKTLEDTESSDTDSCSTDKKEYKPYTQDDFPAQEGISPKLKFSNKEKNLIKRRRYDNNLSVEHGTNDDIVTCKFDISNLTDSERQK